MWRFTVSVMVTTLAVTANGAMGQTSTGRATELPSCTGSNKTAVWTNCAGEEMITEGGRYVGAFRDGKRYGPGAEYKADGTKVRSGVWEDDVFVGGP